LNGIQEVGGSTPPGSTKTLVRRPPPPPIAPNYSPEGGDLQRHRRRFRNVRFTQKSGHHAARRQYPLCAKTDSCTAEKGSHDRTVAFRYLAAAGSGWGQAARERPYCNPHGNFEKPIGKRCQHDDDSQPPRTETRFTRCASSRLRHRRSRCPTGSGVGEAVHERQRSSLRHW
jgi:hypothetical protein